LEITESAAFTHHDLCMSVLKELCSRSGVHLVVDDYGAGHSNLARILDLNPQIVKLDGALIRGIAQDKRRQLMVRHMVALCSDLGARVVAECVETVDELKAVADLGVHYAQGFLLARPAFPAPSFDFPLPRRSIEPPVSRPRPAAKPGPKVLAVDAPAAPIDSSAERAAKAHAAPPAKKPSKRPSQSGIPKRPPPMSRR
jgi:EAL domain-containing protein (putative c-di-GMP-specific phosphodiesterase class I)